MPSFSASVQAMTTLAPSLEKPIAMAFPNPDYFL
jgi:hypothetical protein